MLSPKQSGDFISCRANHVKIQKDELSKLGEILIEDINNGKLSLDNFVRSEFHPKSDDPYALEWTFVVNCLNFSFWQNHGEKPWRVQGRNGYFALCAAINRAMENVDILNAEFYSKITKQQLRTVLLGDRNNKIPLLFERMKSLNDSGEVLLKYFGGSFRKCVEQANHSAVKLLNIITENFKFFRDEASYYGSQVAFYTRAQMLITDIWVCFKNQGIGYFHDINELTVGACYRIPQILVYYNVLQYSDELWQKICSHTDLLNGSEDEVEIRGCTVHAVELLKTYVQERLKDGKSVNCTLIDHFLWERRRMVGQEIKRKLLFYHQTRCIYY